MAFFVVYDELEDDEPEDDLTVTLPTIEVEIPNPHLIPRLR